MADLSQMSDDELLKIAQAPAAPGGAQGLSDEELAQIAGIQPAALKLPAKSGGLMDSLGSYGQAALENIVVPVGQFIDTYTGAPTRAAVGAAQEGKNPISAFAEQFGQSPELAPTGKEIVKKAGVPDTALSDVFPGLYSESGDEWTKFKKGGVLDPTASGVAGFGMDVAADWTNVLPPWMAAKAVAGAGGKALGTAAKGTARAADLITGTKAATGVLEGASDVGKVVGQTLESIVTPKMAADWPKRVAVAEKHGIDPSLLSEDLEFGKGSFISRASKNIAEGPAGEAALAKHAEGRRQINNAVEKSIETVGGGKVPSDAFEAGRYIREAHDDAAKKFFGDIDLTYDSVQKYYPGGYIEREAQSKLASKLNGIEKQAKGFIKRGDDFQKSYGNQLLRLVNQARQAKNFKQLNEIRQWIGKNSYSRDSQGLIRDMYHSMNDALEGTVRKHVSPEFADEILQNNAKMTEFFRDQAPIIKTVTDKGLADENVFRRLFADTKRVESMKKVLGPERFQALKGAYVKSLVKYGADGEILFQSTINNLQRNAPVMKAVFSPAEIVDLSELLRLGADFGEPILSKSGTGASNMFSDLGNGIVKSVANERVVTKLKERARGGLPAKEIPAIRPTPRAQAGSAASELTNILPRFIGKRESPAARRAKTLQSLSVSQTPEQEREKRRKLRLKAVEE